ncbi:MAG TPA: NAD(P)-binding domain-containing protein [Opitutaceae bacterium]
MKIGFIGAGSVAQALGRAFVAAGHDVRISSRDPGSAKLQAWLAEVGPRAQAVSFADAAHFGEVVIPAVQPWTILKPLLDSIGPDAFAGKTVIDLGNAVDWSVRPPRQAIPDSSLGEQVQQWLPTSHVVKTLNMIAAARMAHPQYASGTPTLLVAGNDAAAKAQVQALLGQIGWSDIVDLGDIRQSRLLEAFMMTCLFTEFATKARGGAFAFLRS